MALPSLNGASGRQGVSVSALLSKAVALAVEQHPLLNAHYDPKTKSIVYKKVWANCKQNPPTVSGF